MRNSTLACWLLLLGLLACQAHTEQEDTDVDEKDVLDLTEATFGKTISENKHVLVEFMAPW